MTPGHEPPAPADPAQATKSGKPTDPPKGHHVRRRGQGLGVFLAVAGLVALGYIPNPPETPLHVLVLIVGSGAIAAGSVLELGLTRSKLPAWVQQLVPKRSDSTHWITAKRAGVTAALALVVAVILPPLIDKAQDGWTSVFKCGEPTELRVLSSPDGIDSVQQLAEQYERQSAVANHGCSEVNIYAYAGSPQMVAQAVASSWSGEHLRDLGPRPDVWLRESGTEVDRAKSARPGLIPEDFSVASSPLVLATADRAVSDALAEQRPGTWAETFERASRTGGVVRPDPTMSSTGELATALLYGVDRPVDQTRARSIEQVIGRSLDRDAYPLGDSLDLLCRLREVTPPGGALIVSERAMLQFNLGAPLGPRCPVRTSRPPRQNQMKAIYPTGTHNLDMRFASFAWSPPGQARAAARFGDWLTSDEGKRALLSAGLRPVDFTVREPLSEQNGILPGATVEADPVPPDVLHAAMQLYDLTHRNGRVLLALDASGSMGAALSGGGTRFSAASEGVRRALELMGPGDEFGLWFFSGGAGGTPIREAVPIGPRDSPVGGASRKDTAIAALSQTRPSGSTPLLRAIRDGVGAVGPSIDSRVSALVVLSDGEDTAGGLTLAQVRAAAAAVGVRIFVIAVGETRCAAEPLRVLSTESGGTCHDADADTAGVKLAEVFAALWGG